MIKFGVFAPWYEEDIIPFNLYVMQVEQKREKIENLIFELTNLGIDKINILYEQNKIFEKLEIRMTDLTDQEIDYIQTEVARRLLE